jgi:hypothetical protein
LEKQAAINRNQTGKQYRCASIISMAEERSLIPPSLCDGAALSLGGRAVARRAEVASRLGNQDG